MPSGVYEHKITRITKTCLCCGKDIKVKPSRAEKVKYCSNECRYNSWLDKPPWNKGLTKETDERVKRYSKSLEGKKHDKWVYKKNGVIKKCLYCGKEIYTILALVNTKKYCSRECKANSEIGKPSQYTGKTFEERYGNERAKNIKLKISESLISKPPSDEQKRKSSERIKGKTWEELYGEKKANEMRRKQHELQKGRPTWNKGLTKETNEGVKKISDSKKEYFKTHEVWNKGKPFLAGEKNPIYGKPRSDITKQKISKKSKEQWEDIEYRKNQVKKHKELFQDPEHVHKVRKAQMNHPNGAEGKLLEILNEISPNEWRYNGNAEEGIVIGGRTPDFITITKRKAFIELFGEHVHSPLNFVYGEKLPYHRTYAGTIEHYKKWGFDCLIIWSQELKNPELVKNKINKFMR